MRCLEAESAGGGGWEPGRWYWCLLVALVTIKSREGQDGGNFEKRRLMSKYSNLNKLTAIGLIKLIILYLQLFTIHHHQFNNMGFMNNYRF